MPTIVDQARNRVFRVLASTPKARHDDETLIGDLVEAVLLSRRPEADDGGARRRLRALLNQIHDGHAILDDDQCIDAIIAAVRGAS